MGLAWLRLFFVFMVLAALPASVTASIGKVLSAKQGADVVRAGKKIRLREGMEVVSGDTISTDRSGVVQLLFVDDTKIAIGPNAQMVLDVSMLRGKKKAKSFAVQALGGSFRFISGKSKKRAYSIQTPTATMAVRGTTFDMWVVPGKQSAMLVLEGKVRMCSRSGRCRSTGRQCSLFATSQGGNVGRPVDQEQYELALKNGFPFVQSQRDLLSPLQVDFGGCARESVPLAIRQSDIPVQRSAAPQRVIQTQVARVSRAETSEPEPEPPAPEPPAPEPEPDVSSNRSGQGDGSNPAGRTGPSGGTGNPGKGKGPGHGKGNSGSPGDRGNASAAANR
ncbi:FecR family protein [Ruegeria conchae]|uniref:FecR family protein n=2 Tax=Ruegeria conchae TaxID=981384 RepID=A0A497Z615_9RHOB|nr:FecR family protein [Ruegeria conchae]